MGTSPNSNTSSTSHSLIRRVQGADPASWERFSQLYGPVVYQWARQAGLRPHDAADLMQDVFQLLTQKIEQFRYTGTEDSFRGWLWTITRNKVSDHFRRLPREPLPTGGSEAYQRLLQMPEHPPEPGSVQARDEQSGLRRRALELLKTDFEPQTWTAFWRIAVQGEEPADVAADLGVSRWTVYKAKSRVLQRLREEFAGFVE